MLTNIRDSLEQFHIHHVAVSIAKQSREILETVDLDIVAHQQLRLLRFITLDGLDRVPDELRRQICVLEDAHDAEGQTDWLHFLDRGELDSEKKTREKTRVLCGSWVPLFILQPDHPGRNEWWGPNSCLQYEDLGAYAV